MNNTLRKLTSVRGTKVGLWLAGVAVTFLLVVSVIAIVRVGGFTQDLRDNRNAACAREDVIRTEIRLATETLRGLVIVVVRSSPPVSQLTFDQRLRLEEFKEASVDLAAAGKRLSHLSCGKPPLEEPS